MSIKKANPYPDWLFYLYEKLLIPIRNQGF